LSLQKSPAPDNSVALQKMQYVVNSSHGLLVILYVPFFMILLSLALQKLQYIVNPSHRLLVILYVPFIMMLF
jgi:hypothetical protein